MLIFKLAHFQIFKLTSGSSSFGRAIAFQAIGGQFEPGLPLKCSATTDRVKTAVGVCYKPWYPEKSGVNASGVEHPDDIGRVVELDSHLWLRIISRGSSGVEHFLGREGVVSSILTYGSKKKNIGQWFTDFK